MNSHTDRGRSDGDYGRVVTYALFGFLFFDILSLAAYVMPVFNWVLLPLVIAAVLFAYRRDRSMLFMLPLAELMWGSFGSELAWQIGPARLSFRILLFALTFLYWLLRHAGENMRVLRSARAPMYLIPFGAAAAWGVAVGLARANGLTAIFFDANAYLYLLYVPVWLTVFETKDLRALGSVLMAAAIGLSAKTLILFNIFYNQYEFLNPAFLYLWVRDTRVGELTPLSSGMWRVFLQSQLYIGIALVVWLRKGVAGWARGGARSLAQSSFLIAALLVSLSRSYWLGVLVAVFLMPMIVPGPRSILQSAVRLWTFFLASLIGGVMLTAVVIWVPYGEGNVGQLLYGRVSDPAAEAAGASRLSLLAPLTHAIAAHPFTGSGFGSVVTYETSDPRIRNGLNPTGRITTSAFEWGYLDQWMDLGAAGLALVFLVFGDLLMRLRAVVQRRGENAALAAGLLMGFVFVLISHLTSPYLNHPLGLGYVALLMVVLDKIASPYHV